MLTDRERLKRIEDQLYWHETGWLAVVMSILSVIIYMAGRAMGVW